MNCKDIATFCPLYLSGELDAPRTLTFAQHLQTCEACAGEIEEQTRLDALLRSSVLYEQIDSAALDQRIREHIASERPAFSIRWLAAAAGIAAMLLAGTLGYRAVVASHPPPLCVEAARDHRNEVTDRQLRRWLTDPKAIADLARKIGLPESLVTAPVAAGYRLERGKLCRLDGRTFLHLVYAQGAREFSSYLRLLDAQPRAGFTRETTAKVVHKADSGREHIAYFQTGQLTAMFVSDESGDAALSFARFAARAL